MSEELGVNCKCRYCDNEQRVRLKRGVKISTTPCSKCGYCGLRRWTLYDIDVAKRIQDRNERW